MVVAAVGGGKGKDRRAYYFFKTASQNSQVAQHAGNDVSMSDRTYCTIKNLNWRGGVAYLFSRLRHRIVRPPSMLVTTSL